VVLRVLHASRCQLYRQRSLKPQAEEADTRSAADGALNTATRGPASRRCWWLRSGQVAFGQVASRSLSLGRFAPVRRHRSGSPRTGRPRTGWRSAGSSPAGSADRGGAVAARPSPERARGDRANARRTDQQRRRRVAAVAVRCRRRTRADTETDNPSPDRLGGRPGRLRHRPSTLLLAHKRTKTAPAQAATSPTGPPLQPRTTSATCSTAPAPTTRRPQPTLLLSACLRPNRKKPGGTSPTNLGLLEHGADTEARDTGWNGTTNRLGLSRRRLGTRRRPADTAQPGGRRTPPPAHRSSLQLPASVVRRAARYTHLIGANKRVTP
jgi:hypothetical protein